MRKIIFTLLICFPYLLTGQTNFANLGSSNSGGTGYKTVANNSNIIVSNDMINDGTDMYNPNHSSFVIKANGSTINTFTFSALRLRGYVNSSVDESSTVIFKDKNGNTIQTMTLDAEKTLTTSLTSLTSFFDNGTATPINNVAEIVFNLGTPGNGYTANYNYADITLSDYVLPVELTTFKASQTKGKVLLDWQTATEVNNYGFEVERTSTSLEITWEKIGFVNGHGNSNSPKVYSFTDKPTGGSEFKYRLKQIDIDGIHEYSPEIEVNLNVPNEFSAKQNYPNPFNPSTNIEFSIPTGNNVEIIIFNSLGMEVATLLDENKEAGTHNVEFKANNLSSGIYFYRIVSGNIADFKKMILLR